MISYQWDVQKSMIHVRNELQSQGYKVWMDIDEMGGSTLESMARAVENASVVLMGVSQKYKESPNCRSGDYRKLIVLCLYGNRLICHDSRRYVRERDLLIKVLNC